MTDIVERLRSPEFADVSEKYLMAEAAVEIERLRGEWVLMQGEINRLRAEYDRLQRAYDQLRETYLSSQQGCRERLGNG